MQSSGIAGALRDVRARRNLSQLELALRAGTTQRHVSFIESGRSLPGRGMVIRLAESLELPLRERNDLLLASGFAPAYPETDMGDPALRPVLGALQHILDGHLPFPAIIVNRHGDVVAANAALTALTDGVAPELLTPPVNAYRLALHPKGIAPHIRNLTEWSRHITQRVRQESLRNPDPELDRLLAELEGYAPAATPEPGPDHLGFAVPLQLGCAHGELRLMTTITTFGTATDVTLAELKLEAFLPADEETSILLSKLSPRE
ncbi:MAG: helix-turn-helix domain-containing protein [Pseudonocardiales bacterium]|nr:helix-turn-helix domain-containing protein [Pseudonocardiales bacterium]MBW0010140.1 helix-turn-helix domain-containing protein [Pseudonocardiales bacterium]